MSFLSRSYYKPWYALLFSWLLLLSIVPQRCAATPKIGDDILDGELKELFYRVRNSIMEKKPVSVIQEMVLENPFVASKIDDDARSGRTLLHYACEYTPQNSDLIQFLLQQNPSAASNIFRRTGYTPLHAVCEGEPTLQVVQLLVNANPKALTTQDSWGDTPLHMACGNGASLEVIEYLAHQSPETCGIQNKDGETPLDFCKETDQSEDVINLLAKLTPQSDSNDSKMTQQQAHEEL